MMIAQATPTAETVNAPRFKKGWTTAQGKVKQGFWYVFHNGKKVALTAHGATHSNKTKRDRQLALDARSRYIESLRAGQRQDLFATATRVVTVRQVIERYQRDKYPQCSPRSSWPKTSSYFFNLFCNGHDGSRYNNSPPIAPYAGFGQMVAAEVTPDTIEDWLSHHQTKPNTAINAVKAAFSHAVDCKLLKVNPLARLKVKRQKTEKVLFTDETEKAYRQEAQKTPAFYTFWQASRDMGTRPEELAQLKARHARTSADGNLYFKLDWHEWKNGNKGQTRKSANVVLPPKWQAYARARLAECTPDDFIFPTARGGEWKKCNWVNNNIRIREAAGVDGVTLYSCRHTRITERVQAGESVRLIAILHNTSVKEIEATYCHTADNIDFLSGIV